MCTLCACRGNILTGHQNFPQIIKLAIIAFLCFIFYWEMLHLIKLGANLYPLPIFSSLSLQFLLKEKENLGRLDGAPAWPQRFFVYINLLQGKAKSWTLFRVIFLNSKTFYLFWIFFYKNIKNYDFGWFCYKSHFYCTSVANLKLLYKLSYVTKL